MLPVFLVPASLAQSAMQAQRAEDFTQAIGVVTHLGWWDTAWGSGDGTWAGDEAKVQAELAYLGIVHVRDGAPAAYVQSELEALASAGIRFDLAQATPDNNMVDTAADVADMHALESANPGSIEFYEGANEYNITAYTLAGRPSEGDLSWGAADDLAGRQALKGDPLLVKAGIQLVAASTAEVDSTPVLPVGLVDATNWHVYSGNGTNLQLQNNMLSGIAAARATDPSKPVLVTETGSASTPASAAANFAAAGDAATQAIVDVNAILDGFKDGAARTYVYVLMDAAPPNADLENNFGLFRADGTPKAAATSIHNLLDILADPGAGSLSTGSLPLNLSGLPSTASSLLLQKSSGAYDLLVWNGNAQLRDDNDAPVQVPVSAVSVNLGAAYAKVEVYDPMQSDAPIAAFTNVSAVPLSLSADPLVVQVEPDTAPPALSSTAWYTLTNQNSGSCMDAAAWGTGNGTSVQQWTCGRQQWNQEWQLQPTDSGYYILNSRNAPGEAVDVNNAATANRTIVQLWQSWGGGNQQWKPVALGNGFYQLVGRASGRCLDTPGASQANGVQLQIYDCNGTGAQSFLFTVQP